jgi:hypothetical protein
VHQLRLRFGFSFFLGFGRILWLTGGEFVQLGHTQPDVRKAEGSLGSQRSLSGGVFAALNVTPGASYGDPSTRFGAFAGGKGLLVAVERGTAPADQAGRVFSGPPLGAGVLCDR